VETAKYNVLIVDDDADVRSVVWTFLSMGGHFCDIAADGTDALKKTDNKHYDAIITDVNMPKMNGIDLVRELRTRSLSLPVMIMTGFADEQSMRSIASIGVQALIEKPFTVTSFVDKFATMMKECSTYCQ